MARIPLRSVLPILALVVLAQAPVPAALAQAPTRTTATYEDWTVRCETPQGSAQKSCEVFQAQQPQGQTSPVSQVAIGRAAKTDPLKIVVQVPVNVWLATGIRLLWDDKQPPLALTYRRCVPGGCFADADLSDDLLRRMRGRTDPGRLEYKDAIQRDLGIPVSFKGFAQAIDALAKQ
jgi:invasion protein IalB